MPAVNEPAQVLPPDVQAGLAIRAGDLDAVPRAEEVAAELADALPPEVLRPDADLAAAVRT
jgi:hypothetical protein